MNIGFVFSLITKEIETYNEFKRVKNKRKSFLIHLRMCTTFCYSSNNSQKKIIIKV